MVDGVCPHCAEHTLLISVVMDYYRCLNCGGDIEQKVNGKISYLPIDLSVKEIKDGKEIKRSVHKDRTRASISQNKHR